MGSKFIGALKCFVKRPVDTVRIMLSLDQYDPRAVASIKEYCPDVDVEKLGVHVGIFLAVLLLVCGVLAYILALLYGMGMV
jgi:hypothetical protein